MVEKSVKNRVDGVPSQKEGYAFSKQKVPGGSGSSTSRSLADLVSDVHWANSSDSMDSVLEIFKNTNIQVPVVDDQKLVGTIRQSVLLKYALEMGSKTVSCAADWMEPAGVTAAPEESIRCFAKVLKQGKLGGGESSLIVSRDTGEYVGLVRMDRLLAAVSDLLDRARYANPLTGLPGRVSVDESVIQLSKDNSMFVVAHVGINELHAYNESYGYAKGDQVIQEVAKVLESVCDPELDSLAHLHGGRFTLVLKSPDWFDRCDSAITNVDNLAHRFYSKKDQWEGGVTTLSRLGDRHFSPFFSLSIGAVPVHPGKFDSSHEIFSAASEVEKRASQTYGGAIYVDQRNYRSDRGELTVRLS